MATKEYVPWKGSKKILIILAHPDDPEFFCGATIARWIREGHHIQYILLTKGQKGSQDPVISEKEIVIQRVEEQLSAARFLGVEGVEFLEHVDGELVPDLTLREEMVRAIRQHKPQIVVTCDPQNLFPAENRINHPDHRATGQVVVDAVFPGTGNPRFYLGSGDDREIPAPHQVEELWLTLTNQENTVVKLTDYFDLKIKAILNHKSQVGNDTSILVERMKSRMEKDEGNGEMNYYEKFKRIIFVG